MLDDWGRFEFTGEVLQLVDRVWHSYQESEGTTGTAAERLAGILYVVAALRHDVDAIWQLLVASPELRGIDLPALLQEEMGPVSDETLSRLRAELQGRNWLP
ncbi:MAG: hypothetical protein QME94_15000 [Anaerolineae bacterium]|nr:hypothetical protein [Anaerolineae bacterium]